VELRRGLGLPDAPPFGLHFTVGRLKPHDRAVFKREGS
jgi:hypothetical protein